MIREEEHKIIIVEGASDKKRVERIMKERAKIICTNGTISQEKLEELSEQLFARDVYILVDADDSGEKLRKRLKREFPNAVHLYIDKMYREVATTPYSYLASILMAANIDVHAEYL